MTSEELLKTGGLFKIQLNLADAFDEDEADQAATIEMMKQENGDSHYIVLREMDSDEAIEMQGTEKESVPGLMKKKIANAIVDHSFIKNSKGEKSPNGDVYKIIEMSTNLMMWVLKEWQDASPLQKKMLKASEEQPAT